MKEYRPVLPPGKNCFRTTGACNPTVSPPSYLHISTPASPRFFFSSGHSAVYLHNFAGLLFLFGGNYRTTVVTYADGGLGLLQISHIASRN